jgi:uncharacterized protein (DUF433 family)
MTQPAAEKALLRKTAGVSGGSACVRDTRIAVWMLWQLREEGRTDPQLLEDYPSLTKQDLAAAWEYARQHPTEIRQAIGRQGRAPSRKN